MRSSFCGLWTQNDERVGLDGPRASFWPRPGAAGGARPSGAAHATLTQPENAGGNERPLAMPHGRETAHLVA
jgi:hypothetical protein